MHTQRKRHRTSASRKRRSLAMAGGSGGPAYVEATLGPMNTQVENVYANHPGAPTGGAIWSLNGQSTAYIQPPNQIPFTGSLMSGGGRRRKGKRASRRSRRRSKKNCSSSWFSKLF
jgi:hypothetical protein